MNEALRMVTEGLAAAVGEDCGLGKVVKFDFGQDGVVVIDATVKPNRVHNNASVADCTLTQTIEDFAAMTDGSLAATSAFMSGRLKIEGDMSLAMRLDEALKRA